MNIRGREYDEYSFKENIKRHIDWLWPLSPCISSTRMKGTRPSGFELKETGLVLSFDRSLDIRDLELFRISYNNIMFSSKHPYMYPSTTVKAIGVRIEVFLPWGKKPKLWPSFVHSKRRMSSC